MIESKILVPYLYHVIAELSNISSQLVASVGSNVETTKNFIAIRHYTLQKIDSCSEALERLSGILNSLI